MRLFIAVQADDAVKKALIAAMHSFKKQGITGNYVPAQNLHMTLAFIGEVPDAAAAKAALGSIPAEAFRLSLDNIGYFGDLMYASVKGNQKIKKYVSDLRLALKAQGLPCSSEKFVPHITMIRSMKGKRPQEYRFPKTEMKVSRISLMKSEIKNGKTVYSEVYSVKV